MRKSRSIVCGMGRLLEYLFALVLLTSTAAALASDCRGVVTFAGLPVPGATITVTQGSKKYLTVTDQQGFYSIAGLTDGPATMEATMTGFVPLRQELTIAAEASTLRLELKLLGLDQMRAELKPVPSAPFTVAQGVSEMKKTGDAPMPKAAGAALTPSVPSSDELAQRAADGLLVNGSVNNAATSQFTLAPRFGNTASGKSLYTFALNVRAENSALDAKSFSLAGIDTSKPQTSRVTGGLAVQGPIKIPHVLRNGPNVFVGYQRTQNSVSVTTPGLVPDQAERSGDFSHEVNASGQPIVLVNPATGRAYPGDTVPVSPQAQALLNLYPLPNFAGGNIYNYQIPLVTDTHQDALNANVSKTVGRRNQITGTLAATSIRASSQTLLGFLDTTGGLGLSSTVNWAHTVNAHLHWNVGYQFSRQSNRSTSYWQNRADISGEAGITGNDQQPTYWGPPTLVFSGGLSALTDAPSSFLRNETNGGSLVMRWNHASHNVTVGGDLRRQEFNYLSQADPRGTFNFSGAGTASSTVAGSGSDVADFLLGVPTTSSVAFGNADKYLRATIYDAYVTDDWRVDPQLTVNVGVRYEYSGPVNETKNRLANLEVTPDFAQAAQVTAGAPKGTLTGQSFPRSLMRADRNGVEPRIGASWRPLPGSSLLVSAGYGVTFDSSVYQGIALNLAQQAPFSKSVTLQNSATCPLTLSNGFNACSSSTFDTFAVDPNYRLGYVQTWNLKVQRDLPQSLQLTAIYLGNKGTHGAQLFLPNTNPLGALNPCAFCPSGFEFLASGGWSTRESAQIQLRRRLKSGFTASVLYTYSKSMDDDSSLGGQGATTSSSATIAQDWRNLRGERGLSNFDQRHLLNALVQYTTGMGKGGGALMTGWRGRVYKEWTFQTQITAGSGLPQTPLVAALSIAGYSAFIRPDVTGAPLYAPPAGRYLNLGAFAPPRVGQWGNARRNSVTGPGGVTLNAAMVRTFRLNSRFNLDAQVAASNALNHVTFTQWITNINSTQFGLPAAANAMRELQTSLRLRF